MTLAGKLTGQGHEMATPTLWTEGTDLSAVAVVIPCHNEEDTILDVVQSLPEGLGDWLVVDNGSGPVCQELLRKHLPAENLLQLPEAAGVGGAFLEGCRQLRKPVRWICKLDGDGQFAEVNLAAFLKAGQHSGASFVKTARCNRHGWRMEPERLGSRHWGNQLLTLLLGLASGYYLLEDGTSGLFMAERAALNAATEMGGLRRDHGFETSLLLNLGSLGADLLELRVPICYQEDRRRTFYGRALALPLLNCLSRGYVMRLLRSHLIYRLSLGGLLLMAALTLGIAGSGLTGLAAFKAFSMGMPTTPGISSAATTLLSWSVAATLGFLGFDFASTFRRYRSASLFCCWQPIAAQGIQATRNHQPKRPS
ncbi:glycosyltransferase [Cyanobium sp. WKJ7-Wakatipu]|uniref:glycosyltransferase n=1 Tax=Cyanobium sp. WKJ7-Wakatipu TaxID=2823726 RepID=UPI0020CECC58|nr:glycosyltransferase [Cyanobium sp. WKJ7-Wakatipu]MCP9783294.1 glycosyltransferase [Cyanobium sp. WKJ7-Wakatipu]